MAEGDAQIQADEVTRQIAELATPTPPTTEGQMRDETKEGPEFSFDQLEGAIQDAKGRVGDAATRVVNFVGQLSDNGVIKGDRDLVVKNYGDTRRQQGEPLKFLTPEGEYQLFRRYELDGHWSREPGFVIIGPDLTTVIIDMKNKLWGPSMTEMRRDSAIVQQEPLRATLDSDLEAVSIGVSGPGSAVPLYLEATSCNRSVRVEGGNPMTRRSARLVAYTNHGKEGTEDPFIAVDRMLTALESATVQPRTPIAEQPPSAGESVPSI